MVFMAGVFPKGRALLFGNSWGAIMIWMGDNENNPKEKLSKVVQYLSG
jgi:hypothetical protein